MKIKILTLFPDMFDGFLSNSIIKRALAKNIVEIDIINIRDYTKDKYGRVDTPPVGGGAGLILKCQPIIDCISANKSENSKTILLTPRGKQYNQQLAHKFVKNNQDLLIICGHYEGFDERIHNYVDEEISIGDYILTGGEIASMAIADSIIRLIDGAISENSIIEESFENGLLEYPQYTEPYDFEGLKVPDILYSGNHTAINKWRKKKSLLLTKEKRPDLFNNYRLSKEEEKLLHGTGTPKWENAAIEKGKKFIKEK